MPPHEIRIQDRLRGPAVLGRSSDKVNRGATLIGTLAVMKQLDYILQRFFERVEPLGVAFWSETSSIISFGLPPNRLIDLVRSLDGFCQWHIESQRISAYVSCFGRRGYLIAQFEFQTEYPPPARQWLAFARLAAVIAGILEKPDRDDELPSASVAVPCSNPQSPKDRGSEASLEEGAC